MSARRTHDDFTLRERVMICDCCQLVVHRWNPLLPLPLAALERLADHHVCGIPTPGLWARVAPAAAVASWAAAGGTDPADPPAAVKDGE